MILGTHTWAVTRLRFAVVTALVLALVGSFLPPSGERAQAGPLESHCGTETGGPPFDGFLSHEEVGERLEQIEQSSHGRVAFDVVGFSNEGREIWAARVGHGDTVVLVESQIHGNEKHGTRALLNILATLGNSSRRSQEIRDAITFVGIPNLNMDGGEVPRRQNVMPWDDVMELHPQLSDQPRAWYYSNFLEGFDVNRDFNPDLDYEPNSGDLPGNSNTVGFWITPEARTVREVYRDLEDEFGRVDVFVDLHNQGPCYTRGDIMPNLVTIDEPSTAAGTYGAAGAAFGSDASRKGIAGDVVLVNDGSANPTEACSPLIDFPAGAIALVDRGSCSFVQKANNVQAAGAVAMIVVNDVSTGPFNMGGSDPDITIPSVMVWQSDGNAMKDGLPATGVVAANPERQDYSHLSISGRFITDPTAHGDWPNFDDDASRRINVAAYDAMQVGNAPYGEVTLYPQPPSTNIPGTALGSFALRGSASILFETSGQTQHIGLKRQGMLSKQVEIGVMGIVDAITDGTLVDIDPNRYSEIPPRVNAPSP